MPHRPPLRAAHASSSFSSLPTPIAWLLGSPRLTGTAWSTMRSSRSARCWNSFRRASQQPRFYSSVQQQQPPPWRPVSALDEYDSRALPGAGLQTNSATFEHRWVERQARPISLRQLTFFGRTLTEPRLISSANYVRTELPTRYVQWWNGIGLGTA